LIQATFFKLFFNHAYNIVTAKTNIALGL